VPGDDAPHEFLARHGARIFDERFSKSAGRFRFDGHDIACRDGILRFTPDQSYSTGNFSRLRDAHPTLQLDSRTGLEISYRTVVERCNWPPEYFRDRLVLECGCGAGPDTEALLRLGAQVVSVDLAGTDVARRNVGDGDRNIFVQCSITDLPFRKKSFDIVFCHRVLQHTPDPEHALRHILEFVRDDGAVFVHSYARNRAQMFGWKYVLRPITTRMDPDRLYRLIQWYVPPLHRFGTRLARVRPRRLGRLLFQLSQYVLPLYNYRYWPAFAGKPDEYVVEYAIHNTFDALSPRYDIPMSARRMREIAAATLTSPFEVVEPGGIVLLRTLIGAAADAGARRMAQGREADR
jgi:2-polyprenyl-3-methyl-5-hydroxy-6-metoxy-1,4-benzoquinol methylase